MQLFIAWIFQVNGEVIIGENAITPMGIECQVQVYNYLDKQLNGIRFLVDGELMPPYSTGPLSIKTEKSSPTSNSSIVTVDGVPENYKTSLCFPLKDKSTRISVLNGKENGLKCINEGRITNSRIKQAAENIILPAVIYTLIIFLMQLWFASQSKEKIRVVKEVNEEQKKRVEDIRKELNDAREIVKTTESVMNKKLDSRGAELDRMDNAVSFSTKDAVTSLPQSA